VERQPSFWTVHIPAGYRLADSGGTGLKSNQVEREVRRAAAQLHAAEALAEHATLEAEDGEESHSGQLLATQLRFYRHVRNALYELAFPEHLRDTTADLESLSARLRKLQADNKELVRTHHLERIRAQAESGAISGRRDEIAYDGTGSDGACGVDSDALRRQQGTPTYWQASADNVEPRPLLVAVHTELTRRALGYTGLLLVTLLVAWIVPFYPRAVAWFWALWPEQMIVLGGLAWLVRGSYLALAGLVFVGVAARAIHLGRWIVARFRRPPTTAGTAISSAT
jgi:hypothetical protein